jgi:hypothetical protein
MSFVRYPPSGTTDRKLGEAELDDRMRLMSAFAPLLRDKRTSDAAHPALPIYEYTTLDLRFACGSRRAAPVAGNLEASIARR